MKIIRSLLLLIMLGTIGAIIYQAASKMPKDISCVKAQKRDIERKTGISGIIQPSREIDIKSTISGVIDSLYIQVGDKVLLGQKIARVRYVIDPLEYKRLLKDSEIADIRFEKAKTKFERIQRLYNKDAISKEEYEQEKSLLDILEIEQLAALTEIDLMNGRYINQDLSNVITSTNNGIVMELPLKVGSSVMARGMFSEGTTIAQIADLESLVFSGHVLETDVLELTVGTPVSLYLAAEPRIRMSGHIFLIAPKGNVQDGVSRFEVTVNIQIPDSCRASVRAGCTAIAEIVLERKEQILSIEEKYLQFSHDSIFIEVRNSDGLFERRSVKTGISDGIYTEIISGIDSVDLIKAQFD